MFDKKDEVFTNENKTHEVLSIHAIKYIESSRDAECPTSGFDVHAFVNSGGGYDGSRVFTFEAQTANLCKEWMIQICKATGKFILQARPGNDGFHSVAERDQKEKVERIGQGYIRANNFSETTRGVQAGGGGGSGTSPRGSLGGGRGRGNAFVNAGRGAKRENSTGEGRVGGAGGGVESIPRIDEEGGSEAAEPISARDESFAYQSDAGSPRANEEPLPEVEQL